ncbi:dihydrofolate reductase [Spathaspora passalidarum NRRL Y-27907]|uniref:Dihydrofolate reductase n=1 Tax=Spathaspora passalidarum (strain NRRL Y-27907 / 11-Y1) TaxID=619300 RepID=G3AV57_SPAPN|nr:dihydrofolate reductase [Spathaspora passalidarum NRRL Y-27907]EGW29859.1 dihydrofolate reductase [Spathaspora passalidarum NRRL Y-27907]
MTMTEHKPTISIVVAALKPKYGIGYQGKMPWRLRKEIQYFKNVTSKTTKSNGINAVIMGRKTWESIPKKFRPLPDRINIVLSRSFNNETIDDSVIHADSIENGLKLIKGKNVDKVFIIGGGEIYNSVIGSELVDNLLITEIEHTDPETVPMDTFLKFPEDKWVKQPKSELEKFIGEPVDENITEGDYAYNYTLWTRK